MNQKDKQLLEMAKEKLRWYTLEASDEEFDAEAVDALVNLVSALEASGVNMAANVSEEEDAAETGQKTLEQFREYCRLRLEDEEGRSYAEGGITVGRDYTAEGESTGRDGALAVGGKKQFKVLQGRQIAAVITAACVLVLIAVFSSLGIVNADEDQGFFHWLRRDDKGTKVVTVPGEVGFGVDEVTKYDTLEAVPEEERQYLEEIESFGSLEEFALESIQSWNSQVARRISESFLLETNDEISVEVGVNIFEKKIYVTWEQFDEYQFQRSEMFGEYKQDIFLREKSPDKQEYMIVFYEGNKEYFVSGNCGLEKLKEISKEYMRTIFE